MARKSRTQLSEFLMQEVVEEPSLQARPQAARSSKPYHRRAWSLEHNLKRKASSRNLRDPSPLRKDIGQLESPLPHLPVMDIPEEIKEVDESAASPGKPRAVSADASCFGHSKFQTVGSGEFLPSKRKVRRQQRPTSPAIIPNSRATFRQLLITARRSAKGTSTSSACHSGATTPLKADSRPGQPHRKIMLKATQQQTDGADGSSPTLSSVRDDSVFSISGHTSPMISFSDPFSAKTSPRHGKRRQRRQIHWR